MVGSGEDARGLTRIRLAIGGPIVVALLAGCVATPAPPGSLVPTPGRAMPPAPFTIEDDPPTPTPEPTPPPVGRNTFGPIWPSAPPNGVRIKVDAALLTRDRQTLFITSDGVSNYAPDDPCSEEIQPWVGLDGDTLLVAMTRIPHPEMRTFAPNEACTMELITSRYEFLLPSPFTGSTIRDLAVGPIWVPPPDRVAEPMSLPDGWVMGFIETEPSTRTLIREFLPDAGVPAPREAFFALTQRFGGPSTVEIQPDATATIAGASVPVQGHGTGWIASWMLDGDGITLNTVGIDPSIDAFAERANRVAIPNP